MKSCHSPQQKQKLHNKVVKTLLDYIFVLVKSKT